MKYKVLLIGRNKLMMGELFQYLDEEFEIQTSSMRNKDIVSHLKYFRPDAVLFCMNKEEKERIDVVVSIKNGLETYKSALILIGDQKECDTFKGASSGMGDLVLKKPISVRNIKEKVMQFIDERKAAAEKDPLQSACDIADELIKEISEDKNLSTIAHSIEEADAPAQQESASTSRVFSAPWAASAQQKESAITQEEAAQQAASIMAQVASAQQIASSVVQAASTPQMSSAPVQVDPSAKKHILVVDDDPMMLKLIKEHLKDSYAVATAINGVIALKFLETKKTDLIILDYEMPGENGAQVLEKIRKNPMLAQLPVVFLTGIKERGKIKRVVELKPQGYLLKPIDREKLLNSIKSIIG